MALLEVNKDLEVNFYNIVLPFGLAVNLQIKDGKKPTFDAKEVAK